MIVYTIYTITARRHLPSGCFSILISLDVRIVFGGFFEKLLEFFFGGVTLNYGGDISKRNDWSRNAYGETIKFAFESRDSERGGFGSAGSGRDDVFGGRASFAEILGWSIEDTLGCGVRMHGSHHGFFDAEVVF